MSPPQPPNPKALHMTCTPLVWMPSSPSPQSIMRGLLIHKRSITAQNGRSHRLFFHLTSFDTWKRRKKINFTIPPLSFTMHQHYYPPTLHSAQVRVSVEKVFRAPSRRGTRLDFSSVKKRKVLTHPSVRMCASCDVAKRRDPHHAAVNTNTLQRFDLLME